MVDIKKMKKKICLLGDAAVGKTSLIRRFVYDEFDDKYLTTLGAKVSKKEIQLNYPSTNVNSINVNVVLTIWDILGQKDDSAIKVRPLYFQGANGALVVCDITRKETFESIPEWIEAFFKVTQNVPVIILGNKIDLYNRAEVSFEDLDNFAKRQNSQIFLTSAKTNNNVESAFQRLVRLVLQQTIPDSHNINNP